MTKNLINTPLLTLADKNKLTPFTQFQQTCNWVHKKCLKYSLEKNNEN